MVPDAGIDKVVRGRWCAANSIPTSASQVALGKTILKSSHRSGVDSIYVTDRALCNDRNRPKAGAGSECVSGASGGYHLYKANGVGCARRSMPHE